MVRREEHPESKGQMSKIVVTGAAGFVGHSLLPRLVSAGYTELILRDRRELDAELCARLSRVARISFERSTTLPTDPQISALICLAGATSVDAALREPSPAMRGNLEIAVALAEWARQMPSRIRIVYMSSDEVLGPSMVPLPVNAPLNPTQPYAASKAAAEVVLHNYRDVYALNIATIRACNLVGAFQREPKLLPSTVNAVKRGMPVSIHGSGNQKREWMHVEDLVSAILLLLQPRIAPQTYQAGSGVHFSVNEVVKLVTDEIGLPCSTRNVQDRLVQDQCYAMDASLLRKAGWSASVPARDAIAIATRSLLSHYDRTTRRPIPRHALLG